MKSIQHSPTRVIVTTKMRTAIPIPIPTWLVIPPLGCVPSISPPCEGVAVAAETTDESVKRPSDAGVGAILKITEGDVASERVG